MEDRDRIVTELGALLSAATRASITRGAIYESGEKINDPHTAWREVANTLVSLIEVMVKHRGELTASDEPEE